MATLINFDSPGSAENLRQFEEAMKHGHIRSFMWKLLLYGAAGSGKSSIKEMILGNPPPVNRTSTPLAMRPTTVYRINLDGKEFTTITTLQERRAFLAQALLQSTPNLKRRLHAARAKDLVASSSSNQPVSTVVVSQVQSKDQASPEQGKPPPLDDQPPSASLLEPASLDHRESDDDIDSEVDDILQSISTDRELVKLMGQLSTTVDLLACFRLIQMIDAGGQPQFHEILPVFLRNLSFYVFVFRLCDDLATRPIVKFYVDGKPVGSPFTSAQSIEQLLQHCVRCIHSHRPPTGSESECPQIMVIGTHVDHEKKSSESRNEKNRKILQVLSPLEQEQIIYHDPTAKKVVIPVNAKFPGDSERDIVDDVRQTLFSEGIAKSVDIPLRWFALEILLGEMAQRLERGVLSKEDCITAAIEKLHFEEDAVDAALQYLDLVSAIMYYPKILPNVVFADPQIVLDKISELVFESVAPSKKISSGGWRKFCEHGLVTEKFLSQDTFNSHYVAGLFEVKNLIVLFEKLLVFATFSELEYFVPALLRHLDSKAVDDHRVRCIPSLVLLFPGGGPRQGIFCALLCWLVSPANDSPAPWSISVDDLGSPLCLYRNCVQFDVPDSLSTVTLIDTYTHFEVHSDVPEEFPFLRKAIEKGLRKAALNLGYFNSSPSPALLCPCGRGEAHVAEIIKSTHWKCSLKKLAKMFDKLSSDQQLWLAHTPSADEKSKLSECDLSTFLCKLNPHACKWREIGTHLGFRQGELDNIEHKPLLLNEGPKAWLREMLREWLEWAPGDSRGSSSSASIECLKCALDKSGLAQTALEVESCFTQSALEVASELHVPPTKRQKIDTLASNSVT